MANNASVQRTAPIAIAPKPPRRDPAPQRQDSLHRFEIGPSSVQTGVSVESSSLAGSTIAPCQSCRFSGTKCVLSDDEDGCAACQANGSECSFLSSSLASPQSRKRKMNGVSTRDASFGKRRLVLSFCPFTCIPVAPSTAIPSTAGSGHSSF